MLVTPQRGIDMPAPGNARGERMQQGNAPEGGKRITAHHCRVAKGVNGIIILLPILGECWLRTIPKALPWADLSLAFLSPLCFESEQARAQAVFTPTVYTPFPWGGGESGCEAHPSPPEKMMEKPTPALPKGGGIMFFCPSVRYKRVGFYLPSLGVIDEVASLVEEWGWGWVSVPLPWGGVGGGYPVLLSDMQ